MSCTNYCSGNNPGFLRSPCHASSSNSTDVSSSDVSGSNALCSPSSSQDRPWLSDNRPETRGESNNCLPVHYEPSMWEMSYCPSAACYVPRPCTATSFIPTPCYISSSYLPVPCRPLSCVPSPGRPQTPVFTYGYRPVGCVPCGPQPIRVVPGSLKPLCPISGGGQLGTPVLNPCRPTWSVIGCQ
ncbi:keratin-associated protein 26-1-like [Sorex araneus]|uniref:keratin-associated protein 26-1-like n=1 Tax=Sorex araneus TaxID=42254 RepID=UPI0024334631|nr:keratin-associated protein 26-1-like [Sorex araneus]